MTCSKYSALGIFLCWLIASSSFFKACLSSYLISSCVLIVFSKINNTYYVRASAHFQWKSGLSRPYQHSSQLDGLAIALTGSGLGFLELWIIKFRHWHLHMSEGNLGQPQHPFSDARGCQLLFYVGWSRARLKSREASLRGNFYVLMKASASSRTSWETKYRDWQPSYQKTIQHVCPLPSLIQA